MGVEADAGEEGQAAAEGAPEPGAADIRDAEAGGAEGGRVGAGAAVGGGGESGGGAQSVLCRS